jgi:hypothetical protein
VTVTGGDHSREIGVALRIFDKQDSTSFLGYDFTSYEGLHPHLVGRLYKKDQSVKVVGVGQGQSVHTVFFGSLAELFNGPDTPALGIVGMDVEMNKVHDIFTPEAQRSEQMTNVKAQRSNE